MNTMTNKNPQMNYLNIQLRDMDYLQKYSDSNLKGKFLFSDPKPQDAEEYNLLNYEVPFNKALDEATSILAQEKKNTISKKAITDIFKPFFSRRYWREQRFLSEFKRLHSNDMKLMGDGTLQAGLWDDLEIPSIDGFLGSSIPAPTTLKKYASDFSIFIKTILGHHLKDDPQSVAIINTLTNQNFCIQTAGELSKIFSREAARIADEKGNVNKKINQDAVNVYFSDLFNTFLFGGKITQGKERETIYNVKNFINYIKKDTSKASEIFKDKFEFFMEKYYEDLIKKNSNFQKLLNSLDEKAIKGIYSNLEKISTKSIILKEEFQGKGISKDNERILKEMLKETLRQISKKNGDESYKAYQLNGRIELHEDWRTNSHGFYGQVQVKINQAKEKFREVQKNKNIDKRFYNWSYWVDENYDQSQSYQMGLKGPGRYYDYSSSAESTPLAQFLVDYLLKEISFFNGGIIFEEKHKTKLRKAIFGTVGGGTTRGIHTLEVVSANSPLALRGLYGEIATAYTLRSSKKISTGIVGGERGSNGTGQLHYDVVANIQINNEIRKIGFQVKNYDISKSITLYNTSDGLGNKAMERYIPKDDLKKYRWLFANGLFLTKADFFSSKSLMTSLQRTLYRYTESYLRLTDASQGTFEDQVNSDIFVVGDRYIPSSFLIGMAYHSIFKNNQMKNLFTIEGDFPKYQKKVKTKKRIVSLKKDPNKKSMYGYRDTTWTKNSSGDKNITNLVLIDKQANLLFRGIKINFAGVTANFQI